MIRGSGSNEHELVAVNRPWGSERLGGRHLKNDSNVEGKTIKDALNNLKDGVGVISNAPVGEDLKIFDAYDGTGFQFTVGGVNVDWTQRLNTGDFTLSDHEITVLKDGRYEVSYTYGVRRVSGDVGVGSTKSTLFLAPDGSTQKVEVIGSAVFLDNVNLNDNESHSSGTASVVLDLTAGNVISLFVGQESGPNVTFSTVRNASRITIKSLSQLVSGGGGVSGAIDTDDVTNVSTVSGTTLTQVLNVLKNPVVLSDNVVNNSTLDGTSITQALNSLSSHDVSNASSVGGLSQVTVSDALNHLQNGISSVGDSIDTISNTNATTIVNNALASLTSSDIANDSTVTGTTVTEALQNVVSMGGSQTSDTVSNVSNIVGSSVSDALERINVEKNTLETIVNNLGSDDILNDSLTVTGGTISDAIQTLNLKTYSSDDIANDSNVVGSSVSNALETINVEKNTLEAIVGNLGGDDILNDSLTVTGGTISDALQTLNLKTFNSDEITNNSTITGTTVSDALENLVAGGGSQTSDTVSNVSNIVGSSVSDALERINVEKNTLETIVNNLGSDDILNDSLTVTGGTISDAIQTLNLKTYSSDDIANDSNIVGSNVSDALETINVEKNILQNTVNNLGSDDILNDSLTVTGGTISDALQTLNLKTFNSDEITNNSTITGTTVSDALENLVAGGGSQTSDTVSNVSNIAGSSVSDALETINVEKNILQNTVNNLGSDDILNDSLTVTGGTISDALQTLNTKTYNTTNILNDTVFAGTTLTDVLGNFNTQLTSLDTSSIENISNVAGSNLTLALNNLAGGGSSTFDSGTVSAPSIRFTDNTDTGINYNAASSGPFSFIVNGQSAASISSTGITVEGSVTSTQGFAIQNNTTVTGNFTATGTFLPIQIGSQTRFLQLFN